MIRLYNGGLDVKETTHLDGIIENFRSREKFLLFVFKISKNFEK